MKDVRSKLRRLLYIVPYVAQKTEGVPLEEMAKAVGVDRNTLIADLDMLSQAGPPDGDPGEYLLVTVEDGRVYIDLPQKFTRPLRLTPAEGCSLLLGIRTLQQSGVTSFDNALASVEQKLIDALGMDAPSAQSLADHTLIAAPTKTVRQSVQTAIAASRTHTTLSIFYVSASRHDGEQRYIDPLAVIQHDGFWYIVAQCHKRQDLRTFRVDRMRQVTRTDKRFTPPQDFDVETYRRNNLYVPSATSTRVTIDFDAVAAARIGSVWPTNKTTQLPNGSVQIELECEGLEWVTSWVLSHGKHAKIVAPASAQDFLLDKLQALERSLSL